LNSAFIQPKDLLNAADSTADVSNGFAWQCAALHWYLLCIISITTVHNCS